MTANRVEIRPFVLLLSAALIPLLFGGICPMQPPPPAPAPPPGNTTLLSETVASVLTNVITTDRCAAPNNQDRGILRSFIASAGKLVTVQVVGPLTSSRPQIQVTDPNG